MPRETYWRTWIIVILALGVLRLYTLGLPSASSNPTPSVQSTPAPGPNPIPRPYAPTQTPQNIAKPNFGSNLGGKKEALVPKNHQEPTDRVASDLPPQGISALQPLPVTATDGPTTTPPEPGAHEFQRSYFTLNSTKEEVLKVQGTPTRLDAYEWAYGLSTVQFRNDRVVSWTIYGVNPLRAKMIPSSAVSNAGYFTVGSTKDEVLAVQGTPTKLDYYEWGYGLSTVQFRNDRVVSWTIYGVNPLRAKMIPSSAVSNAGYFTVGSTKDEVLAVQGTPTKLDYYEWGYGLSTVQFRNDRVVSWTIYGVNPLRAKMIPSSAVSNVGYFTVGSTKDEVLAVQGTPTKLDYYEWGYGLSTVQFRNDRVVSWTIYGVNPLRAKMAASSPTPNTNQTDGTRSSNPLGVMVVTSDPSGAEVYVDDSFVAKAPATLNVKVGQHYIRAFLNGYRNWSRQITIDGHSETNLAITLEKSN